MHFNMSFVKYFGCTLFALLMISQNSSSQQTYCGPALYDVLDGICINGFEKMHLPTKKRAELPSLDLDMDESENAVYMNKMYGGIINAMAKTRRRRHGIYDECCRKGCTFNELATYCS